MARINLIWEILTDPVSLEKISSIIIGSGRNLFFILLRLSFKRNR